MTQYLIQHTLDGYWIVVRSADGRPPYEQVGRKWPNGALARAFYDTVSRPVEWVSPLRSDPEAASAVAPVPGLSEAAHPASSGTSARRPVSPG